jgi:hypothetical protein
VAKKTKRRLKQTVSAGILALMSPAFLLSVLAASPRMEQRQTVGFIPLLALLGGFDDFSIDTDKIMSQCSFSSTSYVASATAIVQGIQVQATKPATTSSAESGGTTANAENISKGRVIPVMAAVGISILTWMTL